MLDEQLVEAAAQREASSSSSDRDGFGRGVAVDALADQLTDKPAVSDRLALRLDVEPRVEAIVEKALELTAFDRCTRRFVVKALAFETLPEVRLRAALPRQAICQRGIDMLFLSFLRSFGSCVARSG